MSNERQQNLEQLSITWCATVRTISRWKHEGAPLDDADAMRLWLAGRKHLPAGTRKLLETERRERRTAAHVKGSELATGAAPALRRLEEAEASAFADWELALKEGNPLEIKLARDGWLRVGESLRKYELAVEQSRRDAGELVPRAELEKLARGFTNFFRIACVQTANSLTPQLVGQDEAEICERLKFHHYDCILHSFAQMASAKSPSQLPPWLLASAIEPMNKLLKGFSEAVAGRAEELSRESEANQPLTTNENASN